MNKPYYADELITLFHGDCRDLLSDLAAFVVVTDPPYGETNLEWDRTVVGWPGLLRAESMWVFGSFRAHVEGTVEIRAAGWRYAQEIIWEKHNGSGLRADRFRRVHEIAVQFYRGAWSGIYKAPQYSADARARTVRKKSPPKHWHGATGESIYRSEDGGPRLMRSVIRVRTEHMRAVHPTQKPIGILVPLISYSCPPGGVVLDPFAGSGSTLVAAKQLGRRGIGIEIDERYCAIAAQRLAQETLMAVTE